MFRTSLIATALMIMPSAALADSFALSDFSAADFARANAGRVTYLDDAGIAYSNPALMTLIGKRIVTVQISGIFGDGTYIDDGSIDVLDAPLGGNANDILPAAWVPSLYAVWPINERTTVGLAINTPFGLSTDYDSNWAGRYQALKSELSTINLNPSIAYQLTDNFSIGAGINLQYIDAELTNAIDFGAVCLGALDVPSCVGFGLLPQAADGEGKVEGDDWSWGYNIGTVWTPHPDWRFGAHFRSGIDHEIEGDASFTVPAVALPLTAGGGFAATGAQTDLNLPGSAEFGVRWQASEKTALYATAQWMDWSQISQLAVTFDNPAQPASVEALNYEDAHRYGFGGDYQINETVTFRAGIAFDSVPNNAAFPAARIPDEDRVVYAAGLGWQCDEKISLNAAITYIDFDDQNFDRTGAFAERVQGQFNTNVPAFSVNMSFDF